MSAAAAKKIDRSRYPYRMKDLCDRSGLPRQVIHFYIQQGLVPEGKKTGRNMAYYADTHLERIALVRRLQHERFLPLKAIKAILEDRDDAFTPAQRALLFEVKRRLGPTYVRDLGPHAVDADEQLVRLGLTAADLDALVDTGMVAIVEDRGRRLVAADDVWMFELWAELRAAGFSAELGFTPRDVGMYADAIERLFGQERALLLARVAGLPAPRVAELVERVLPLVNTFLARLHVRRVQQFFSTL